MMQVSYPLPLPSKVFFFFASMAWADRALRLQLDWADRALRLQLDWADRALRLQLDCAGSARCPPLMAPPLRVEPGGGGSGWALARSLSPTTMHVKYNESYTQAAETAAVAQAVIDNIVRYKDVMLQNDDQL